MTAAPKPMAPATIRRLMEAQRPEAERSQRVQEAEARGRLFGLEIVRLIERGRVR